MPFGVSQVCTSASSKFVVKTCNDYAPSPCNWLSQSQTTTGCCHSNSAVISYCLETSHIVLLNIFFRVSVVPYDISLHNAVAPVSTPSATLSPTTEGLRANILYWINAVTKMTYAFTATESHKDLLSLISDNPTLRSLLPTVLSNCFQFYTHSIFTDSRVICNHLRFFHAPSPSFIHCVDNIPMHIGDLEL